jgi:hypothetical protein
MIDLATEDDRDAADKHAATERKKQQLAEAEKEHDRLVQEEAEEEEKEQKEAEEKLEAEQRARHENELLKEHEAMLQQLSNSNAAQLNQAVNIDDL